MKILIDHHHPKISIVAAALNHITISCKTGCMTGIVIGSTLHKFLDIVPQFVIE